MKNTLESRIIIFSFIFLFLIIFVVSATEIVEFRKYYVNTLVLRSQSLGTSMKGSVEKVVSLGLDLKDVMGISEKCRELVQGNPDISYCIITDLEGKPLFLNDPAFVSLQFGTIKESITTKDNRRVNIIGNKNVYYDTVTPVFSSEGKVVAQIHVGFQGDLITQRVSAKILRSIIILLISFLISFSLVVLFVKKSIVQPISALLKGVKQISEGAFDTKIEEVPIYEFNQLAKNINFMSESLKFREEEIQQNYRELAGTHDKLRSSYGQLESLSHELERSEQLYKSLLEDSSDAIIVIDNSAVVRMVNKMAEDFFGYSANELIGLPMTKLLLLLNIENIPKIHKHIKEVMDGRHIVDEIQFTKKEGSQVLARINVSSIKGGNERLVQAIFHDITKEMAILKNLQKSTADLARLNKMKDSFLGLASHELKTPLTVIMGYTELILTDMNEVVDKTVREMVENISNAALRLDNIVRDMVDVSMIDERRLQLRLEDVDVNRLIETSINELRFFFTMRKQELVVNLDESLPSIKGDNIRLMQLLSNVLGNAIKFTPDGGKITVTSTAKYLLRSKQPEISGQAGPVMNIGKEHHLYVEISIADNGIGIDREDHLRIFEKFYEAGKIEEHSSGKVAFKAKGAGLGLAIAKGIVEMHGGEMWVESPGYSAEKYPGSTFYILLPLNPITGDASLDYMNLMR